MWPLLPDQAESTAEKPRSNAFKRHGGVRSNKKRFNGGRGIEGNGVIPHEIVEYRAADPAKKVDTLIEGAGAILESFPRGKVPCDPAKFGWTP